MSKRSTVIHVDNISLLLIFFMLLVFVYMIFNKSVNIKDDKKAKSVAKNENINNQKKLI